MGEPAGALDDRFGVLEGHLARLSAEVSNLAAALDAAPPAPPREQERLRVDEPAPAPKRRAARKKS
jgi:hypothetical protein